MEVRAAHRIVVTLTAQPTHAVGAGHTRDRLRRISREDRAKSRNPGPARSRDGQAEPSVEPSARRDCGHRDHQQQVTRRSTSRVRHGIAPRADARTTHMRGTRSLITTSMLRTERRVASAGKPASSGHGLMPHEDLCRSGTMEGHESRWHSRALSWADGCGSTSPPGRTAWRWRMTSACIRERAAHPACQAGAWPRGGEPS